MSKHTPGPWNLTQFRLGWNISVPFKHRTNPLVEQLVTLTTVSGNSVEAEANARLIAAAPELLEACQFIEKFLREKFHTEDTSKYLSQLKKAIAKAEGTEE